MKAGRLIRRLVDAAMYGLMLLLMGQCVLRGAAHEGLGISAGVLFALHCALNGSWYKALFKGKYSALRTVQTVVNLLLILVVLACMVSGILVSQHIFAVGRGRSLEFGRHLHLVATAWAFVLMTVHLGLHWSIFTALGRKLAVNERAKRSLRLISCLLTAALCLYGLYQFIDRRFWEELFHLIDYQKEYDSSQPLIVYWAGTAALSVPFIAAAHYGKRLMAPRSSPAPQNARRHRNRRRSRAAVCDRRTPH